MMKTTTCNECGEIIGRDLAQSNCWLCETCLANSIAKNMATAYVPSIVAICTYHPPTFCDDLTSWALRLYEDRTLEQTIHRHAYFDYRDTPEILTRRLVQRDYDLLLESLHAIDIESIRELPIQIEDAATIGIQSVGPKIDLCIALFGFQRAAKERPFSQNALRGLDSFAQAWQRFDVLAPYSTTEHWSRPRRANRPMIGDENG